MSDSISHHQSLRPNKQQNNAFQNTYRRNMSFFNYLTITNLIYNRTSYNAATILKAKQ